ncbi:MAG: nicotinate (nicotinamide) nucleotide adenylyltransferase, partial [Chitinophagaceae bacterium]
MRVGLYFGSFNPIHIGHLIIANHVLNETSLDRIWFMVSPQNPFKKSVTLLNEYDRLHLVKVAVEQNNRFRASDIEFSLPKPSYTVHTLAYLKEKHPTYVFSIIMGSDSYQNLPQWHNSIVITENYDLIVYQRPGFEITKVIPTLLVLEAPLLEISATHIRKQIREGKS